MKHKKGIIIGLLVLVIVFVAAFPYIKAEYLTKKYGHEFENLQEATNIIGDVRYLKVLSYSPEKATAFYVSDTGDLLTFEKTADDTWAFVTWYTVWSKSGSADGFMWPYYR